MLETRGNSTWGWKQNSMITIDPATNTPKFEHEFYLMKHLCAFVQPGAVRLGLSGQWTSNALAFENPNGSVVLVMANPFNNPRRLSAKLKDVAVDIELSASSFHTFVVS